MPRLLLVLLLTLLAALYALPAPAQDQVAKFNLKVQPARIAPGQSALLVITVKVDQGFHLNSDKPLQPELIPTAVQFENTPGLKFGQPEFPKPHMLKAGFSESPVAVFDGEFQVKTAIKAAADAKPGMRKLKLTFSYQACDNQMCMMPLGVELSTQLEIK